MSSQLRNVTEIREKLVKRKQELDEELSAMSREPLRDFQVQDSGDQAMSSTMELLRTSLQDTEVAEYKRIIEAIKKIDEGTYGICIDCSGAISAKRLELYPNASRCLACQELFEEQGF